jgi:hypothetical protein
MAANPFRMVNRTHPPCPIQPAGPPLSSRPMTGQEHVLPPDPSRTIAPPAWARSGRWFGIDTGSQAFGLFRGCLLAVSASISFAWSRVGILSGMFAADLALLRFVVAGVILLPVSLRYGALSLAGIGWPRGLALLLTGGPLFILPQAAGYVFAPFADGGVIAPPPSRSAARSWRRRSCTNV